MDSSRIARVQWQAGQMLLPEHFHAQDGALSAEALLSAGLAGLPPSGIGALELNRAQFAEGTFARVYRGRKEPGGQSVAVKVLRKRFTTDPNAVKRFNQEAEAGMKLVHPNIVRIYDIWENRNEL